MQTLPRTSLPLGNSEGIVFLFIVPFTNVKLVAVLRCWSATHLSFATCYKPVAVNAVDDEGGHFFFS